jgi:hypothetical protein
MATQTLTAVDIYFFLCNPDWKFNLGDGAISTNQDLCDHIRNTLSIGEFAYLNWSCANTKKIQVGDRAYLVRSSSSPTGIIASGIVVEGLEDEQLRNLDPQYADLSAAYVSHADKTYYVSLQIDSVVDFEFPLEQSTLKQLPQFRGVNFQFQGSGKQFAPGNPEAIKALASEWETHSLIQQRKGYGRRLVDFLVERGDEAKLRQDFWVALGFYQQALEVDPNYTKAAQKAKSCQVAIDRLDQKPDPSPIITPPPSTPPEPTPVEELVSIRKELDQKEPQTSSDSDKARRQVLIEIARRQGQTQFRQALLAAYGSKCAITGFDAEAALEAAHIIPYAETDNNDPSIWLLLRSDLHTLFDLNLLVIHPDTHQVLLCPTLRGTEYRTLHGKPMRVPAVAALKPNPDYLRARLEECSWLHSEHP